MNDWKEFKLGELAEITSSKRIYYSDYVLEGIPFFRSKEIIDKSLGEFGDEPLYISREKFFELKEKFGAPQDGDLLISAVGERSGIPYVVRNQGNFYFKDGNLIWLRNIKPHFDIIFFYYWIKSNIGQMTLESIMIGSAQKALTIIGLKNLKILLPPLPEQRAIATVLSGLDEKIDLLHRQNKTLEAMAETFFRQWFVEEADEGWEEVELGDVIETTSGGTPSRSNMKFYENGTIHWVKSKELNGSFIIDTEEKITEDALQKSSAKILPQNSILIAMYGATVGEYGIISREMSCNQAICALKPNENYPYTFLFLFVKSNKDELINMAVGSAQQNISQLLIKKLPVPNCIDRIKEFHLLVSPYFEKIKINITQILVLEKLRDMLLPKLMSGEVKITV